MVLFFKTPSRNVIAVDTDHTLSSHETEKLSWLFSEAEVLNEQIIDGWFVGPRKEMITPWSTNAVEITQNMGLSGISRIEEYFPVSSGEADHDPMLQRIYNGLNQDIFTISKALERFYDVKIILSPDMKADKTYSGVLKKKSTIESVLKSLQNSIPIDYKIVGNNIFISPK